MPEGPELHLASRYINAACAGLVFCGPVEKSEVSKNPEVPFRSDAYRISAASRGKEVKLTLAPLRAEAASGERGRAGPQQPMDLVFRFGMSGGFTLAPEAELPKHAHLRFYTRERPRRALCFVDLRRFGRWEVQGTWQPDRGPCVLLEYEQFRENVLKNLSDKAFNKPICEALLNQKFFNGIGNYLRAEILYRLKIPPFEKARTVLEALQHRKQVRRVEKAHGVHTEAFQLITHSSGSPGLTLSKKVKLRRENPDLVELCHTVPLEVVHLGGKGYSLEHSADAAAFEEWLQCYSVPGMKALRDSNGRTIWFHGEPGPMAPKGEKSLKKRSRANTDPEPPNPKVTKPASQGGRSREKVTKRSGREKGKELVQGAENAQSNETRKPKARSRRKASASQESPKSEAPAAGRKRRASARRSAGTAATTRSRRAKVE